MKLSDESISTFDNPLIIKLKQFHLITDEIIRLFYEIQTIIKLKQQLIDKSVPKEKFDLDPDGSLGSARPLWLDLFINKFNEIFSNEKIIITKGKLSSLMSYCIFGRLRCTEIEINALEQLIHASNDTTIRYNYGDDLRLTILQGTREYWATRLFEFIKKIPEIKSMASDEKSLLTFDLPFNI